MTRSLLALAVLIAALFASTPAQAASLTFTVTKTADTVDGSCFPSNCSLRDAVDAANATADADTIVLPAGHYTLTGAAGENSNATGDLDIIHDVTLTGAGVATTVIDGDLNDRLVDVLGATTKLSLSGVTLTRGSQQTASAIQMAGAELRLDNVSVTGNVASSASDYAFGAIFGNPAGSTSLTIMDSSFTGNVVSGGSGKGGYGLVGLEPTGNLTVNIANSVFASNNVGAAAPLHGFGEGLFRLNAPGGTGSVTIDHTAFTGNQTGGGAAGAFGYGLVIFDAGGSPTLTIKDSSFSGNTMGGDGGGGYGPIYYTLPNAGTLNVSGSTFSDNKVGGGGGTGQGGALFFTPSGGNSTVDILNSTFTGNKVGGGTGGTGSGGAIYLTPTGGATATATLSNVTMVSNTAGGGGATGTGGGYFATATTTKVANSIIAGNNTGGGPANCNAAVTSLGHNIEDAASCAFTAPGDQNTDPLVGPLGDFGGPTLTRPLLPGSPAIDHGDGCDPTDQRGLPRPFGAACDVGAYEYAPPIPTTGGATGLTTTSAVLSGQVSPNLRTAAFHFDYGRTTSYGSTTADQTGGGLGSLPAGATLAGLTPGTTYHYRLVASGDNTSLGADRTFTTRLASLSRLKLSPARFPAAPSGGSVARKKRRKTGTNISYTASDPSTTTFRVLKPAAGRRQGKSCRKPSPRNRRGKKCTRYLALRGSFKHTDKAGRNKLHFTGRLKRQALKPGKYRLAATPRAGGKNGRTRNVGFKIVP